MGASATRRRARCGSRLFQAALLYALLAGLSVAPAQDAASLRDRHSALHEQLAANPFQRPIHVESSESANGLRGEIYARIGQPFTVAGPALRDVTDWCDILILHLNVKGCRASGTAQAGTLSLHVGRKHQQPLAHAYPFEFLYRVTTVTPEFLQVRLDAAEGPLGTRGYGILLEVVAIDAERSFLHLSYAYTFGMAARVAVHGYLATIGRNKVGFSLIGTDSDGQPVYIGGMRGMAERNTMSYYLAIEAYLGALSAPASQRLERRLTDWHAGVERYPLQLHEIDRDEYLEMKRQEVRRQQAAAALAAAQP